MEMETALPEAASQPGTEGQPAQRTDGLAASLAVECGAPTGAASAPEIPGKPPKRPGRPPIHGLYSKAAGSDGHRPAPLPGSDPVSPAEVEMPGETRVSVPPDVLAEVLTGALTLGEEFAAWKMQDIASRAGLEPGEINTQLARAQIGPQRREIVSKLTPLALQEWGIDPQISPTACIGITLAPWVFATVTAYFTLAGLAAERLSMEKRLGKSGETKETA